MMKGEPTQRSPRRQVASKRSPATVDIDSYRDDSLYPRIARAVEALLARGTVVAPVDVLVEMGCWRQNLKWIVGGVLAITATAGIGAQHAVLAQEFSRWSSFCQDIEHTAGVPLGDLDEDGDLDVIFANGRHFAEPDWVFSNDGRGTFYGKRVMESQPDRSYGIALGDLDGNGTLDAVVANDAGNRSMVYRNDGLGNLRAVADSGLASRRDGPWCTASMVSCARGYRSRRRSRRCCGGHEPGPLAR